MTATTKPINPDDLDALRAALIERAHRDAEADVTTARTEAAARRNAARVEAEQLLVAARERGRADAAQLVAEQTARVARQARDVLFHAQRELYEQLCDQIRDGARRLREDPCYSRLCLNTERRARSLAGVEVSVREHRDGGLVIEAPGRRIDASLDALAEWAIASLSVEAAQAWTS